MENFELTEIIIDTQPEGSYFYTDASQGFGACMAVRTSSYDLRVSNFYINSALLVALQKGEY